MAVINSPFLYVPDPTIGRPLFNGQIYVGEPDLDPEIIENQKQLNIIQEDGTKVPLGQPFTLSSGGIPIYDGSPVRLDVDGNYSFKILSQNGDQIYYIHNVLEDAPITSLALNSLALTTPAETYDDLLALDPANYSVNDNVYVYGDGLEGRHYKVEAGSASNNPPQTLANATWNAASKHWELVAIEKGADGANGLDAIGTIDQIAKIPVGDAVQTSSTAPIFIPSLSNKYILEASKIYEFSAGLKIQNGWDNGIKFQINIPAGAVMRLFWSHVDSDGLGVTQGNIIGDNAVSFGTTAIVDIPAELLPTAEVEVRVTGDIIMASTESAITVGFSAKVISGASDVVLDEASWMKFTDTSAQPNVVQGDNIVELTVDRDALLTDAYKFIMTVVATGEIDYTVPLASSVPFPKGTELTFSAGAIINVLEGSPGVDIGGDFAIPAGGHAAWKKISAAVDNVWRKI